MDMPSQTASTDTAASPRQGNGRPLAQRAAPAPGSRRRRATLAPLPPGGILPRYCDRKPPAMLDDGWIGETLNHADEIETIESGDDFLIDFGDLEDSR
jgi:hypothetical protein